MATTYQKGDKYAGGNTFIRPDGTRYQVYGEFVSPSGKVTYTDDDGSITVLNSKREEEIGRVYNSGTPKSTAQAAGTQTITNPRTYESDYQDDYRKDYENMQVEALKQAMGNNKQALQASYDASINELDNAIKAGQRQAYVNQQKALKSLPQTMAAAGYSGGMTESTAADIANEYQNAFNDLQRTRAAEAARLQADLANGIANTDTQYQLQIADTLQAAQQFAQQQQQYEEQMAMQRAAAALEQDRYEREWAREQQRYADQLALQQRELALDEARYGVGGAGNTTPSNYTTYIGGKKYTGVYQGQDGRTYGRNSNGTLVDLTDMNPF